MSMYVCVVVSVCVHVSVHMYLCVPVCVIVYISVSLCIFMWLCILCGCVHDQGSMCDRVCPCVCVVVYLGLANKSMYGIEVV